MGLIAMILLGLLIAAAPVESELLWKGWQSGRIGRELMPQPYRDRESLRDLWHQRFSEQSMERADAVLNVVCDAFLFNPGHRYKLSPDDTILSIYLARYPDIDSWLWQQLVGYDIKEIETVLESLNKRLGFQESYFRRDMTIAEIVEMCSTPMSPPAARL